MEDPIKYCKNAAIVCSTLILVATTLIILDITIVEIVSDIVKLSLSIGIAVDYVRTCYAW